MRTMWHLIFIALFWLASPAIADDDLTTQRAMYTQAMQALNAGNIEKFNELSGGLRNYPLYPYLVYAALNKNLAAATEPQIANFLSVYKDTPLASSLRENWLALQAGKQNWSMFLKYYKPSDYTELECQHAQALLMTGKQQEAFNTILPLWLTGYSQPEACEVVFSAWSKHGGLTQDLVWRRINLAINQGNMTLSKKLMQLLPKLEQNQVVLWQKIHADPMLLYQPDLTNSLGPYNKTILLDGMLRLAAKNPERLSTDWVLLHRLYNFTPAEDQLIIKKMALALAQKNNPQASAWFAKVTNAYADKTTREWRIRAALQQKNWPQVSYWIAQLPPAERNSPTWRYWQARALAAQGNTNAAAAIYQSLAGQVDYYGLLASKQLQQPYKPFNKPITVSSGDLTAVNNIPGVQRARELYYVDDKRAARREWNYAIDRMDAAQIPAAALLASQWHWYDRAIETALMGGIKHDLALRYPVAYKQPILYFSGKFGVDPAWAYAITHQESEFMADSESSVGAAGLMQLMPSTAKQLARGLNIHFDGKRTLLDVNSNIGMGVVYLRDLLKLYRNDYILATAAYNAGSGSVKKWLGNYNTLPQDIWIENIPWQETRNYVKLVTLNRAIYQQELGK